MPFFFRSGSALCTRDSHLLPRPRPTRFGVKALPSSLSNPPPPPPPPAGLPIFNDPGAICPPEGKEDCPFTAGPHSVSSDSVQFPTQAGTIVLKTKWNDQDGAQIFCISMKFSG